MAPPESVMSEFGPARKFLPTSPPEGTNSDSSDTTLGPSGDGALLLKNKPPSFTTTVDPENPKGTGGEPDGPIGPIIPPALIKNVVAGPSVKLWPAKIPASKSDRSSRWPSLTSTSVPAAAPTARHNPTPPKAAKKRELRTPERARLSVYTGSSSSANGARRCGYRHLTHNPLPCSRGTNKIWRADCEETAKGPSGAEAPVPPQSHRNSPARIRTEDQTIMSRLL